MNASELLRWLATRLNEAGIPFMLTGSVAAAYHGAGRATMDLDLVIAPTRDQLDRLLDSVKERDVYVSADAAFDALDRESMVNVVETTTGWKADLIVRKSRQFSQTEFARRRPANFEGTQLWVATIEDTILSKPGGLSGPRAYWPGR